MRSINRLEWLLGHPWAMVLIAVILVAVGALIVWYNVQETKVKEEERRRDRASGDSIWDD